jgi:hypothetical protein
MKFMGLILMCAASSMALLLPAMGVVKFPVLDQTELQSLMDEAQAIAPAQSGEQLTNLIDNAPGIAKNSDPQTSAGLLVAAQVSGIPSSAEPKGSTGSAKSDYLGKIPFTQIGSQRMGLGVWLLLLPTILLGLLMWTFGSSPKSSK